MDLVEFLNEVAGSNGVGRIDHVENRLVGIKSREIYEAPAAVVLHQAHRSLEALCITKEQSRFKERMAQEYADIVYNGLWFSAHRHDLDAYVRSTQTHVSGTVRMRLFKGTCTVAGRKSDASLYRHDLATYAERRHLRQHRGSRLHPALRPARCAPKPRSKATRTSWARRRGPFCRVRLGW